MTDDELERKRIEIISKAWTDDSFKAKLMSDPIATLKAEGVDLPAGLQVRIVENTENVVHFVLPLMPKELTDQDLDKVVGGFSWLRAFSGDMSASSVRVNTSFWKLPSFGNPWDDLGGGRQSC